MNSPAQPSPTSGVRVFPPIFYIAGIAAGFLLQWVVPVALLPESWALPSHWIGTTLVGLWLTLSLWAVTTFRRVGTTPNPTQPTTALALSGPYRFTRNPMYLGLACLQAGTAFLGRTVWPLLTLPLVLWMVRRQVIDREERYLAKKFGDDYRRYKAAVRRWF
ncbi:MAG: isoprenylcysteine carboxylmethyltransferase family protein [Acidobacteriota bacterium]